MRALCEYTGMRVPAALFCLVNLSVAAPPNAKQVLRIYRSQYAGLVEPLLLEAIRFPTVSGDSAAHTRQKLWLQQQASKLGLIYRDAGPMAEVELPGPAGAPVLGLVVHGDVQPPGEGWTEPPFTGVFKGGYIYGRGAADDKGPMVQALLAMASLAKFKQPRTYTIRLLVGSDEESGSTDITEYLKTHAPPSWSWVLDSGFPVVVGEKAWDELQVIAEDPYAIRGSAPGWVISKLDAGFATSIVPNKANATLEWRGSGVPSAIPGNADVRVFATGNTVQVEALGKAAHAGMNIEGGRNALLILARALRGEVADSGASDLLTFALEAGKDLYGGGLGLTESYPVWGRYSVNVAKIKTNPAGALVLSINLRRTPPRTAKQIQEYTANQVASFNRRQGTQLRAGGIFVDEPLVFDPETRGVKYLMDAYRRATGKNDGLAISGGGTYAKRLPNSIAFGMWFPGKPYPGHDTDERISIEDLQRGSAVLLEALTGLVFSPELKRPFER